MQNPLPLQNIIKYLKENIEPFEDNIYGPGYRVSVYLTDGTYLPCVIFRNSAKVRSLTINRFKESKNENNIFNTASVIDYYNIIGSLITCNCLNVYNIAKVEKSPYAFPISIQKQIQGETTMGWTYFVAKMKDGMNIGFGTNLYTDFFDMPQGYSAGDISEITNHSYITQSGQIYTFRVSPFQDPNNGEKIIFHREKPFFVCYLDNL